MTDNKCNCTNCKNLKCPVWIGDNIQKAQSGKMQMHHIGAVVDTVGCFYHSNARTFLMKDVIEELENKVVLFNAEGKRTENPLLTKFASGMAAALALIKNGVKE